MLWCDRDVAGSEDAAGLGMLWELVHHSLQQPYEDTGPGSGCSDLLDFSSCSGLGCGSGRAVGSLKSFQRPHGCGGSRVCSVLLCIP